MSIDKRSITQFVYRSHFFEVVLSQENGKHMCVVYEYVIKDCPYDLEHPANQRAIVHFLNGHISRSCNYCYAVSPHLEYCAYSPLEELTVNKKMYSFSFHEPVELGDLIIDYMVSCLVDLLEITDSWCDVVEVI